MVKKYDITNIYSLSDKLNYKYLHIFNFMTKKLKISNELYYENAICNGHIYIIIKSHVQIYKIVNACELSEAAISHGLNI